jgi:transcriptional regulator with XRE-family HTH domain
MLENKSQALLSLQDKAILYPAVMTLGKRIKTARKAVRPKLTQAAVAKPFGITAQAVSQWERDEDAPTPDKFPKLAEILRVTVAYLHGEPEEIPQRDGNINQTERVNHLVRNPTLQIIPNAELMGDVDLPVYSIVQGGRRGALVLENEPFTSTARPKRLVGKRDGFGVLVIGNSMAREYNEGDIAYIDPHLHARKGDPCVFQGIREDGTVEAMLKYLERSPDASETVYYVSQSSPPKKFTIKKAEWRVRGVAVGKESGR